MNDQSFGAASNGLFQPEVKRLAAPRELLFRYLRYLPWVVFCAALAFVLAYINIRYSVPVYQVQSSLLIQNDDATQGDKNDLMGKLFMASPGTNLQNEIHLLRSTPVLQRVVKDLDLQTTYYNKGKVRRSSLLYKNLPFQLLILELPDSNNAVGFAIKVLNDKEFLLNEGKEHYFFDKPFALGRDKFMLIRDLGVSFAPFQSPDFVISWSPANGAAWDLDGSLKIAPADDQSTILQLSMETEVPNLGIDVLNTLMQVYDSLIIEDKNRIATNSKEFIDKSLDTLRQQLGGVEGSLRDFMVKNQAFNIEGQAQTYLNNIQEGSKAVEDQQVKITIVDWLLDYIGKADNTYKMVPTDLGVSEPVLMAYIEQYNRLQLDRESNLKTTPAGNPMIAHMDASLDHVRQNMLQALRNVRASYEITKNALLQRGGSLNEELKGLPGKSMQQVNIQRRQKILEDLYSFLLQRKYEISISSASTISNSKVVEPAYGGGLPIRPKHSSTYLTYLLVGLIIPVSIIAIIEVMNDKVRNRLDIEKVTSTPILGEIGHSEGSQALVVTQNSRRFITEQFRIVRTNLQYILGKNENPVILVTSSFSGEGKSFISTNMGAVMGLAGKKTVVMEFDIRKPKIVAGLELKRKMGITNYIIGAAQFDDLLVKVDGLDNFYVIPCGPIPPNPAELLLNPRLKELIAEARKRFDVVIMDTAPVGLVSDAITLAQYADCTLYIVRRGHTPRGLLNLVNDLYVNKKLPAVSILLNDMKQDGAYYGGYYGGYGYGYYGYGHSKKGGYFDNEGKKSGKGFLSMFKRRKQKY
jgi:tyrosine-protein kinase Etk/Wzc